MLTLYAKSEKICRQVGSLLKRDLGDKLFDTRIRGNAKAKFAPGIRKTIFEYERAWEPPTSPLLRTSYSAA